MGSRTFTTVVTSDTIALNAAIFGYAGHSLVTPHAAIQQIFWTDERINLKVTRDFIVSKLRPDEKVKIFSHVSFGDDLTSCKYLDWVLEKAKRFFLILVEAGVPDQIFGIIDDAWTDEDLPIALKDVPLLRLSSQKQEDQLNHKFYTTQFRFLLRSLTPGAHIQYGPNEVVPLEYVHRLPAAAALMNWQKAHLPKHPDTVLVKRKVTLGKENEIDPAQEAKFLNDIEKSRLVEHKHIAPIWASYTVKGSGFILTTFEAEHTLKSFIDFRIAASFQKLTRAERTRTVMMWFHCLADALVSIHAGGFTHTSIMPSNIIVDGNNHIAFSDIGSLKSFQSDKKIDPSEVYNYGAPEDYSEIRRAFISEYANEDSRFSRFSQLRGRSNESNRFSTSRSRERSLPSAQSNSSLLDFLPPGLVSSKRASSTSSSEPSMDSPKTPTLEHTIGNYDFTPTRPVPPIPGNSEESSEPVAEPAAEPGEASFQPLTPMKTWGTVTSETSSLPPSPRQFSPLNVPLPTGNNHIIRGRQADLFSLGCIFLDLMTYLLRKKAAEFTKHRTTKRKIDLSQSFLQNDSSSPTNAISPAAAFAAATTGSSSGSPSTFADNSFHANISKLDEWMQILEHEAEIQEDVQFRAVPALMRVIRAMLTQNGQLRPTAYEVRERILDALVSHARIEGLCCKGVEDLGRIPDVPKSLPNRANSVVAKVIPQIHSVSGTSVMTKARSFWGIGRKKDVHETIEEVAEPTIPECRPSAKSGKTSKSLATVQNEKESISKADVSVRPKTPRSKTAPPASSSSSKAKSNLPPRTSSMAHRQRTKTFDSPSSISSSAIPARPSTSHGSSSKSNDFASRPSTSHSRNGSRNLTLTALDLDRPLPKLPRKAVAPPIPTLTTLTSAVFVPPVKKTKASSNPKTPSDEKPSTTPSKSNTASNSKSEASTDSPNLHSTPTPAPKQSSRLLHKKSAPELRSRKNDVFDIPPPPLPNFKFDGRDMSKDMNKAQGAMLNVLLGRKPSNAGASSTVERKRSVKKVTKGIDMLEIDKKKPIPPPPYLPPAPPLPIADTIPPPPPIPSVPEILSQLDALSRTKSMKSTKSARSTASAGTITVMHRLKSFTSWKSRKMSTASSMMDAADAREKEEEDAMIVEFPSMRLAWDHDDAFTDFSGQIGEGLEGLRIVLDHD